MDKLRVYIDLVEAAQDLALPEFMYHGTTSRAFDQIVADCLHGPSHWTDNPDIARWFSKHKSRDKGGRQVLIRIPSHRFDKGEFSADLNIMDFPIPAHEADHEERLSAISDPTNPSWQDSLRLFNAVIYVGDLDVDASECFDVRGRPLG